MALASLYRVTQDLQGNIVTDVLGTVTLAGTSTLASLFSDSAGTTPLPNPLVNNPTYGSFQVYVGAGLYDMSFVKAGFTFETQRSIALRDPAAGVNQLVGTANQVLVSPAGGIGTVTLSLPQNIDPNARVQFQSLGLNTTPPTSPGVLAVGDQATTRTNLGLGTMATQDAGAVAITGGGASGLTSLSTNGVLVPQQTGNNLYGYYSALTATPGSERYFLYAAGDAPSYVTGRLFLNSQLGLQQAAQANIALRLGFNKSTQYGLAIQPLDSDTPGTAPSVQFFNLAGTSIGSITTTATATAYNTSSDVRLKHAIQALGNALSAIQAVKPVRFRWNADDSQDEGFLAHELQQVLPHAVTGEPDAVNEDGSVRPQQVDASKIIPRLVGAVQELLAQVETLTTRVAALEAQPA